MFYLIINFIDSTSESSALTNEEKEFYSNLEISINFQEQQDQISNKIHRKKTIISDLMQIHKPEIQSVHDTKKFSQIENHKDILPESRERSVSHRSSYKPIFAKLKNGDIIYEYAVPIGNL